MQMYNFFSYRYILCRLGFKAEGQLWTRTALTQWLQTGLPTAVTGIKTVMLHTGNRNHATGPL